MCYEIFLLGFRCGRVWAYEPEDKAILHEKTMLFPVGGIIPESMESYPLAGATGFGLGSALYRPAQSVLDVGLMGKIFIKNWKLLKFSMNQIT
jgi:2-dehydro-3-deoxyphosphogalactonate aldolase